MTLSLDQHMLADPCIRDRLIEASCLEPHDIVVEIGAGQGFITKELAKHCRVVHALEQDQRFTQSLATLPPCVTVHYGNALTLLNTITCTKIISNLPFSITEPFFKSLPARDVHLASLIISSHFYSLITQQQPAASKWGITLPLFYRIEKVCDVPRSAFSPQPKVACVLVQLTRRTEPVPLPESILRPMILAGDKKVKNALTNAIKTATACTKWEARQRFYALSIPFRLHEKRVDHLSNRQFQDIAKRILAEAFSRRAPSPRTL